MTLTNPPRSLFTSFSSSPVPNTRTHACTHTHTHTHTQDSLGVVVAEGGETGRCVEVVVEEGEEHWTTVESAVQTVSSDM